MQEVLTDRRRLGLSPPSAIDMRKLSRLRVKPRVRSAITWFSRTSVSRPAICHSSGAVADRRWLRSLLALLRHRERKHHGATRLGQGPGIEPLGPGTVSDGT